ncbi:glycosyltransferase [Methylotuvimicrobium sp. KM1]|uniref:glycosyltransferase n=1 Tax=Methylotuvimicrobium sp. KM1 TaxID=3377707 RepID=UPI00384E9317
MAHGLDVILDAAEMLRDRDDIVFLTAGDGAERARLQSELERRGLRNVKMLGQLPKEQMPALWSITSVSLVLLKKLDLFLTVIPSKIFETMAMKKPIILGVRGESREIVEKAGSGIGIEPENAMELAAAITALADAPEKCAAMGVAGKACVSAEFDRQVLARRFEEVLESVV